jgi:hypothetical protein
LLKSIKLQALFSSIAYFPPNCNEGYESCLAVIVVGFDYILIPKFYSIVLGLKVDELSELKALNIF